MATSRSDSVGARSIGHRSAGKGKGGWLKWLLPAFLLLLVIGALIALLSGGDEDEASPASATPAVQSPPTGGSAAGAASAAQGTLVGAGQQSLLGASAETFGSTVGEQVTGRGLGVLSVVGNDGFFVGTSERDRVYVEFGADVGEDETAADVRPAVGDRVNLDGELRPAPQDPGRTLRLEQADAQVVERQGAFVNATSVSRGS